MRKQVNSAQHKRPGRSAKRRRQERALERLEKWIFLDERMKKEAKILRQRISQPLLPAPAKQAKRAKGQS